MRGTAQPDYAGPRQQWMRPGFILSAAFMVLVIVVGVVIALTSGGGKGAPAVAATDHSPQVVPGDAGHDPGNVASDTGGPVSSASIGAGSTDNPGPGSAATASPDGVPLLAPPGVTWQLFGQVALPYSATAGPSQHNSATATGYAHTATGALLASAQLVVRSGLTSGRAVWEPTITGQFVPGNDRDHLLASMRSLPEDPPKPGELAQISGFMYQSYSSDTAVVGLVLRAPTNEYFIVTTTLQWRDNDWRMVAPPGGNWTSLSHGTNDLTGVVEWGAV